MVPVLFNLYTTLVIEHWQAKLTGTEGAGVALQYKQDRKLFRKYTRSAEKQESSECFFTDNGALLASSRGGAETAVIVYQETDRKLGLTVHITKANIR